MKPVAILLQSMGVCMIIYVELPMATFVVPEGSNVSITTATA